MTIGFSRISTDSLACRTRVYIDRDPEKKHCRGECDACMDILLVLDDCLVLKQNSDRTALLIIIVVRLIIVITADRTIALWS